MSTQSFGKYQLVKKLATGGMAEVWLALQTGIQGFNRHVVVKRILPHLAEDPEFVQMFLNEAKIASRFSHPNIGQIYDLGEENGTYYIAMEFIHGEDLGRVMRRAWSSGQWVARHIALRIIADAAQGLYYAHSRTDEQGQPLRVVHRDISPQNILVSFDGAVKIVDFGIAKAADQVSMTKSGAIKGKFAYMAPEQAAGKVLDARTDIFALGLVLYELITGVRPLKRESELGTLQAALEGLIEMPSAVAEVPPEIDDVVMRALAKNPDDRYRDAREFQKAIEQHLLEQKEMATALQVSELMEMLFSDRLNEEKRLGAPNPSTESSTSNPAAVASYSAAMKPPTPVPSGEQRESSVVSAPPQPRSTPPQQPDAPLPSSTLDEDDDDEPSRTDPELTGQRRQRLSALPEGTVGPSRKYATSTVAALRPPSRVDVTRARPTPVPQAPPEPLADGEETLGPGDEEVAPAPPPRRNSRVSTEAQPDASPPLPPPRRTSTGSRKRSSTNSNNSSMPEAPPRRSRPNFAQQSPAESGPQSRISKLVDVEEMKSRANSRLRALISVLLLAAVVVLIVVFKEQLLTAISLRTLPGTAGLGSSTQVRFSVTTNPPTHVFVVPPIGSDRPQVDLGSTPLSDASAALGDTVLLVNEDRGIHWQEVLDRRGDGPRMIEKVFKEVTLNVTTQPKLKNASVWRGGMKLGQAGVRFSVFPGTHHFEIHSDQLKEPFPFDVTIGDGQVSEKKVDVSSALEKAP